MSDLKHLLDFADFKTTEDIQEHFYKVAQALFYKYELKSNDGQILRITDVELYIHHKDGFKDKAMHNPHHSQMTSGRFYIHRHHHNQSVFKKPSHIGLDITCGSPFSCYAGILIRETKKNDDFLSCSKTVLEMIGSEYDNIRSKKWNNNEIAKLHELDDTNIFTGKFSLSPVEYAQAMPVWSLPRKVEETGHSVFSRCELRAMSEFSSKSKKNLNFVNFNAYQKAA